MRYDITLLDESVDTVTADGYTQEGPLTTFFCTDPGRAPRLDSWATRILSVRTDRIMRIARFEQQAAGFSPADTGFADRRLALVN